MEQQEPRKFGKYWLKRPLGHGAMGPVYLAEDETSHQLVALKILPSAFAANGDSAREFLTQAKLASQLNHPNIVKVLDYGKVQGQNYLAMEYIPGENLKTKTLRQGRIHWREAVHIALQVACGLAAAAEQGIIHRDIKPENILIDPAGRIHITDLGLAKEMGSSEPLPSDTSLGTPDYMSPEQINNSETVDYRSDIYSLGATLFHMICGKAPYTGHSAYEVMVKHVVAELPSPLKYVPDLPPQVCDVMRKMMAREPRDRYATYEALIADLEALLEDRPVAAASFTDESLLSSNGLPRKPQPHRHWVWMAVAAVPIVIGMGVLIYLLASAD